MSSHGGSSGGGGAGVLDVTMYAPTIRAAYTLGASLAALDTTNMTFSFTTAASGAGSTKVLVRAFISINTVTAGDTCYFGFFVHGGSTVAGNLTRLIAPSASLDSIFLPFIVETYITGLTANTAYQYDLAGYSANANAVIYAQNLTSVAGSSSGPAVFEVLAAP